MDPFLSPELIELRARLRAFIDDELLPLARERRVDEDEGVPAELRKLVSARARALGFYQLGQPTEDGGTALGPLGMVALKEEIARSGSALARFALGSGAGLLRLCSEVQRERFLKPVLRGEKSYCFAMTELVTGSGPAGLRTAATLDGRSYIINGKKNFVTNGVSADFAVVMALVPDAPAGPRTTALFLVEKGTPGFSIGKILNTMAGGNDECELVFEDCRVPADNVLGQIGQGFPSGMQYVTGNRLYFAALAVGTARRLLDLSADFVKRREERSTPPPPGQEVLKAMLADMATDIYAGGAMTYQCAWLAEQGEDIRMEASMAKLFTTEMVGRVADAALQIHGAQAYVRGHPIERLYRVVRGWRIAEGTSEVQRATIGSMLTAETEGRKG